MERRLAAILAVDVVGYTRLMGADEAGTLARLKALRGEVIDPEIARHNGRSSWVTARWSSSPAWSMSAWGQNRTLAT